MARILVTGSAGFVGTGLVARLLSRRYPPLPDIEQLMLIDQVHSEWSSDPRVCSLRGDLTDAAVLKQIVALNPDVIFHLACIPSGLAESNFLLGRRLNLDMTLQLYDGLANRSAPPIFIQASSVAVFPDPPPTVVTDDTPAFPSLSYGAHKQMTEIALSDYSRLGLLRGFSLRLPGIVPRADANGALSAFSSELMQAFFQKRRYSVPVAQEATVWLMSRERCVDNLLHAAFSPDLTTSRRRVWTLPALHTTVAALADACSRLTGILVGDLITYRPIPEIERLFGNLPKLAVPVAEGAGFRSDGTLNALVLRSRASSEHRNREIRW